MDELQEKPGTILLANLNRIKYFYIENSNVPGFKVIADKGIVCDGFILPKYSPLRPILFQYFLHYVNTGLYDKLAIKWLGQDIPTHNEINPVISFHQTLTCFIFLISVMVLCIILVQVECIIRRFYKCKNVSKIEIHGNWETRENRGKGKQFEHNELIKTLQSQLHEMSGKVDALQQIIQSKNKNS